MIIGGCNTDDDQLATGNLGERVGAGTRRRAIGSEYEDAPCGVMPFEERLESETRYARECTYRLCSLRLQIIFSTRYE